jgi:hypothetical protein
MKRKEMCVRVFFFFFLGGGGGVYKLYKKFNTTIKVASIVVKMVERCGICNYDCYVGSVHINDIRMLCVRVM